MEEVEDQLALLPNTLPENCQICIKGVEEAKAKPLGEAVGVAIAALSRAYDLERLDGVTLAIDYVSALMELNRGFQASCPLVPTTENGRGVAMAPMVMRDGMTKAHILIDANIVAPIVDEGNDYWWSAFYTLAHECAHVQLLKLFDKTFPNVLLKKSFPDYPEGFRWNAAQACWDEYAACRLSACMAKNQTALYEESLVEVLKNARSNANAAIREYRWHRNVDKLLKTVTPIYIQLMTFASYLMGHLAGIEADLSAAPRVQEILQGHWFSPFYARLQIALETLWQTQGIWSDLNVFDPIGLIAEDVLDNGGIGFKTMTDGRLWVDVPFKKEA